MQTLIFPLDEIPLVIVDGVPGAHINGQAEIAYSRNGDWWIESVTVEGDKRVDDKQTYPQLVPPGPLVTIICQRLEGELFGQVQDHVNAQIEEDRVCAADDWADHRRDMMMGDR